MMKTLQGVGGIYKKIISQCPAYNKKRGSRRIFFLYMPRHLEKEHISLVI